MVTSETILKRKIVAMLYNMGQAKGSTYGGSLPNVQVSSSPNGPIAPGGWVYAGYSWEWQKRDGNASGNLMPMSSRHELGNMVRRGEEVKEQGKERGIKEDEMETDVEVEEVIEEEESKFKTDEEVEEEFKEEEEDEDDENFNSFQL
ncbi:hypothetical protein Tco_0909872 [Tanacetum coccineum]|uniref:Uncharacterized protein n=1 Tax=Tanacetum coccineum TaxID=301880 RepID=A0ABQ5CU10_9ASTR